MTEWKPERSFDPFLSVALEEAAPSIEDPARLNVILFVELPTGHFRRLHAVMTRGGPRQALVPKDVHGQGWLELSGREWLSRYEYTAAELAEVITRQEWGALPIVSSHRLRFMEKREDVFDDPDPATTFPSRKE